MVRKDRLKRAPILYTFEETWSILGVSRSTFYRMLNKGDFTIVDLGPQTKRISQQTLIELIEEHSKKKR